MQQRLSFAELLRQQLICVLARGISPLMRLGFLSTEDAAQCSQLGKSLCIAVRRGDQRTRCRLLGRSRRFHRPLKWHRWGIAARKRRS